MKTLPPKYVVLSTTLSKNLVKCWTIFHSFVHNSLVSRLFLTRKVSNRNSRCAPRIGQRVVSSIQLSVWSTVRSGQILVKLGQPWSNLVKALRTLGNVSRATFCGFLGILDPRRVGNGLVNSWSNLVNLGKTWSDFGKCTPDPVASPRWIMPAWFGLPRFTYRCPRKSQG